MKPIVALTLLLIAGSAAAIEPLTFDLRTDVPVTLGAIALGGLLGGLESRTCRWCEPDAFDRQIQSRRVWRDAGRARRLSDDLASGAIPAVAVAALALSARSDGGSLRTLLEDGAVVAQAVVIAGALNAGVKSAVSRRRPDGSNNRSFYSGHTSLAFSLATATATVSTIRGYRLAPWVWAAGTVLATGVAYLRVAGNAHWTTDVVAGAAAGGGIGFGVPWLLHRRGPRAAVTLVPAPGGLALIW